MRRCVELQTLGFVRVLAVIMFSIFPANAGAIEISDGPMEVLIHTAPPILILLLDNSGSMDSELMTPESFGLFREAYYIFPDGAYEPRNDHIYGAGHALGEDDRRAWKTQWAEYNRVYYSPGTAYVPWPSTALHSFGPADLNRPLSDPASGGGRQVRLNLAEVFFTVTGKSGTISVFNAHYFVQPHAGKETTYLVTWEDDDGDGYLDLGDGPGDDRRKYYRFTDNGDGRVTGDELALVSDIAEKNAIRPVSDDDMGGFGRYATDREELQNFANWFSYYRRRMLAAKSAGAALIARPDHKHVGLYAVNASPRMAVRPVGLESRHIASVDGKRDPAEGLLDAVYAMTCGGRTPLRQALDQVGRYIHQGLSSPMGPSPFVPVSDGGACQRSSVVVITDGIGNGADPAVGNVDGDDGRPFADGWPDTLADVAMRYYEQDLAPGLPDDLSPLGCDDVRHQHLTTSVLSFDIPVTVAATSDPDPQTPDTCQLIDERPALNWPLPLGGDIPEMPGQATAARLLIRQRSSGPSSDNLWHAVINGRGSYFRMHATENFDSAFPELLARTDALVSSSAVAVNSGVFSDQSVIYQAQYHTGDWRGEVTAIARGGDGPVIWRASDWLMPDENLWGTRCMVSYGGYWRHPQGVPFRYGDLSAAQMAALGSDLDSGSPSDRKARELLTFIRGKAVDGYRQRESLLGDIVHATPVLFGDTLFAGGNDGMLHVINAQSGQERFAYVPNLVLPNLKALAAPSYPDRHRFFVDGPLYVGEVLVGPYQRKTYLVGGLGRGGKGYYCILVGHRERPGNKDGFGDYQWKFHVDQLDPADSEQDVASYIRWEYPRPRIDDDTMDNNGDGAVDEAGEADPDLGFSFGQAFAVNGNSPAGTFRPMVILANGYDSPRQSAVLYILSADSGELIRKIDTGATGENGLSTPALVDVDLDRRVDYAYAGDLQGNLWKFDLSAESPDAWAVAYGEDHDGNGVIDAALGDTPAPLFHAENQPITSRPDIMIMNSLCAAQVPGYLVVFGTGQYLGAPDRSDHRQQSLYGIWDYGDDGDDSETLGSMVSRSSGLLTSGYYLQRCTIEDKGHYKRDTRRALDVRNIDYAVVEDASDGDGVSGNNLGGHQAGDPEKFAGWFYDLAVPPPGVSGAAERVTADAMLRGGKAIFTSYRPDDTPCGSGGASRIYILSGCHGSITEDLKGEPLLPIQFEGKLNDHAVAVKDRAHPRMDKILTSDPKGRIRTIDILGERWGKVSWRQNIAD